MFNMHLSPTKLKFWQDTKALQQIFINKTHHLKVKRFRWLRSRSLCERRDWCQFEQLSGTKDRIRRTDLLRMRGDQVWSKWDPCHRFAWWDSCWEPSSAPLWFGTWGQIPLFGSSYSGPVGIQTWHLVWQVLSTH